MNLGKLQETVRVVRGREVWCAAAHRVGKSRTQLSNYTHAKEFLLHLIKSWERSLPLFMHRDLDVFNI